MKEATPKEVWCELQRTKHAIAIIGWRLEVIDRKITELIGIVKYETPPHAQNRPDTAFSQHQVQVWRKDKGSKSS